MTDKNKDPLDNPVFEGLSKEEKLWIEKRAPTPTIGLRGKFPNAASHCDQEECGISLFGGILVQWDEDHDTRVIAFLQNLPDSVFDELLVVQEHEGSLYLIWKYEVPEGYAEGDFVPMPCGDIWNIHSSFAVQDTCI